MKSIKEKWAEKKRKKYEKLHWKTSIFMEVNKIIDNENSSINEITSGIQDYYSKLEYNEELLLYRMKEIQKNDFTLSNISASMIGLTVGSISGASGVLQGLVEVLNPILGILSSIAVSIVFVVTVSVGIVFLINIIADSQYSDKKFKKDYISKKELEIIAKTLEGVEELTLL